MFGADPRPRTSAAQQSATLAGLLFDTTLLLNEQELPRSSLAHRDKLTVGRPLR